MVMKEEGFTIRTAIHRWVLGLVVTVCAVGAGCGGFSIQLPGFSNVPAMFQLPGDEAVIPFTPIGGYVVVDVMINDAGPYKFILDTGASISVVSPGIAADLPQVFTGTTSIVSNVDPNSISTRFILIDHLTAGEARFERFQAAILPSIKAVVNGEVVFIDGILGIPLFQNLLLTVDYPANQVRVGTVDAPPPDGCSVIRTQRGPGDLPTLPMTVAGREVLAVIDTGNNEFLLLPSSFSDLDFVGPLQTGTATTVTGTLQTSKGVLDGNVVTGCQTFVQPSVTVGGGIASVGAGMLSRFRITIDQRTSVIWFLSAL